MEVHMRGLPEFLTEQKLKEHLVPIMKNLGIPEHPFACEKGRSCKWANVTISPGYVPHGIKFMKKHGETWIEKPVKASKHPPPSSGKASTEKPQVQRERIARLKLPGNVEVFCSVSNRPADPVVLRGLEYDAEEAVKPTRKIEKEAAPDVFGVMAMECGLNVFDGDKLVFVTKVEFYGRGVAKFFKRQLVITYRTGQIIKIALDTVVSLVCSSEHTLTLTLTEVAAFFLEEFEMDSLNNAMNQLELNAPSTRYPGYNSRKRRRVSNFGPAHERVVGTCLVYRLQLVGLSKRLAVLKHHDGVPFVRYDIHAYRMPPPHLEPVPVAMDALVAEIRSSAQVQDLPFGVLFQLQALASNAYLHPTVITGLLRELRRAYQSDGKHATGNERISVDALKMLFQQISWPQPYQDPSNYQVQPIMRLLQRNESQCRTRSLLRSGLFGPTQNLTSIHRATVTPSRTTLHGPDLDTKNRVLRKFPDHHDYFLRVQFADENGQDLYFNHKISHEPIWERFKRVLSSGIEIGGRTYGFLGFSHSSLRSHSAWFVAPFMYDGQLQTFFSIIQALGEFSEIRSPARCAARIGQAFSETPYAVPLDDHGIRVREIPEVTNANRMIPDVSTANTQLVRKFSDGLGKPSLQAARAIWDVMPHTKAFPTAFQIRFRGCKGMLALDSRLPPSRAVICIRPSMRKFASQDAAILEICDSTSRPIPLVLNRQMVKILEDMQVDPEWFLDMQSIEVFRLREVTADTHNVANFLRHEKVGDAIRLHRLYRQSAVLGIDWRKDPFLCSVVETTVLKELRLVKHKARIPTINKGVTLLGIMDETGFLQEGQVYVTYNTMGGKFAKPPKEGPVIVTRSPALHSGDIQLALQVIPLMNHPLRDHSNVIVFSRHGQRDLPSQLSGGDLDGDIYNIIWDERAMPKMIFTPADYAPEPPKELDRPVEKEDMAESFVDFMQLDHLGVIATRHMILARLKARRVECALLARLHSTAVDFSKTGNPVDLKALPRAGKYRPDFLAPGPETRTVDRSTIDLDEMILDPVDDDEEGEYSAPRPRFYKSEKILGHLYRAIDESKIWKEHVRCHTKQLPGALSFWDDFLRAVRPRYTAAVRNGSLWLLRMSHAWDIRSQYDQAVSELMAAHSQHPTKPLMELEVFIGTIINKTGTQTNRQRDNSIKLHDAIDRVSSRITSQIRKPRDEAGVRATYGANSWADAQHDGLHLAMACVHVGGQKDLAHSDNVYEGLQSFRIVAACALLAELNRFPAASAGESGGWYLGVRGKAKGRKKATVPGSEGIFSHVPPPPM